MADFKLSTRSMINRVGEGCTWLTYPTPYWSNETIKPPVVGFIKCITSMHQQEYLEGSTVQGVLNRVACQPTSRELAQG